MVARIIEIKDGFIDLLHEFNRQEKALYILKYHTYEEKKMTNQQIREMLYAIIEAYNGFDGNTNGLLLINDYIQNLDTGGK